MKDENLYRPYSPESSLTGCGCACGRHGSQDEHDREAQAARLRRAGDAEALSGDFVEAAAVRALFPHEATRRNLIKAVGAPTLMAASATMTASCFDFMTSHLRAGGCSAPRSTSSR